MAPETTVATDAWDDAVRRATAVADRGRTGGMDKDFWDDVATRDIIAVVLYALHVRLDVAVDEVPWAKVLWWLWEDGQVIVLVEETVPGAGQALEPDGEPDDAVASRWRWLNRTWDPQAPFRRRNLPPAPWEALLQRGSGDADGPRPEPRWEGISRGIADGLSDPALVRNSSGVSPPSLSHQSADLRRDRERSIAPLGVSEIVGKHYTFETIWRLAA